MSQIKQLYELNIELNGYRDEQVYRGMPSRQQVLKRLQWFKKKFEQNTDCAKLVEELFSNKPKHNLVAREVTSLGQDGHITIWFVNAINGEGE